MHNAQVSRSAYDAAKAYWPDVFAAAVDTTQQSVLSGLKKTRPVLIRGYESMVMVSSASSHQAWAAANECNVMWSRMLHSRAVAMTLSCCHLQHSVTYPVGTNAA